LRDMPQPSAALVERDGIAIAQCWRLGANSRTSAGHP